MIYKILKALILIVQISCALLMATMCIDGFVKSDKTDFLIIESAIRCITLISFSLFYYHSLKGGFGSETLMIPFFLMFSTLTETRFTCRYLEVTHTMIIPPVYFTNIFLLCTLLSVLSIMGYCLYYNSQDTRGVIRYSTLCLTSSIFIVSIIPKTQTIKDIWNITPVSLLLYTVYITAFVVCLILLMTDTPGISMQRHVITIILIAGNYLNLFFNSVIMDTIGTVFLIVACIFIGVLGKRNSIKL